MDGQQVVPQPATQTKMPPAPFSETPAAKQQMQAGLGAIGAQPKPMGEGDISQQITGLQDRMKESQAGTQKELRELGKPPSMPDHQPIPPKDASTFFSLMMVLGALGGRSTMAPMTAAMNNMTAIMKAQHEGNKEMLAAQKEQFHENFNNAVAKHKEYTDAKKDILERNKYDMKSAEEELRMLRLQHGISDSVAKATNTSHLHDQTAREKAEKFKTSLMGGGKAAWKPTGKLDAEGHQIYHNAMTNEERPGKMLGTSEKETAVGDKNVRDLEAKLAAALAKPDATKASREAAQAQYGKLIAEAKARAGGGDVDSKDPLGLGL